MATPAMDADSDSSLSEAPEEEVKKLAPIFLKAKKATKLAAPPPKASPPRPKREPSPPHEEVLADNPDIAFLVMFRSRFTECFPGKCPQLGPQDIERGVVDTVPSPEVQHLLCALLGLVLNRKKPVERTSYARALEESVLAHKSQWPHKWAGQNPLHGGKDFNNMPPSERLNLLRTLSMWALGSSELVSAVIKDKYKQQRHNDDQNQPLSVQPWGTDGDHRRYFLVQGLDDTSFRIYREGSRYTKNAHWYSQAGTIDEAKALAVKLETVDKSQKARTLAVKITNAVPMFEATEEKRNRRIYRQQRRAAFTRPEPGFGIYEGRTRGKRMRYTYDEEAEDDSDATSTRRSTRHQSSRSTPFETGPQYTASGRQIKQPRQGDYGESLLSTNMMSTADLGPGYDTEERSVRAGSDESDPVRSGGRPSRASRNVHYGESNPRKRKHIDGYNDIDDMSDEDDAAPSGDEWNSDQNEDEDMAEAPAAQSEDSEDEEDDFDHDSTRSLIVKLKLPQNDHSRPRDTPPTSPPRSQDAMPKCESVQVADEKTTSANSISHSLNGDLKPEATPLTAMHTLTPTSPKRSPQVLIPSALKDTNAVVTQNELAPQQETSIVGAVYRGDSSIVQHL
ncbi:Putative WHIM1 domain-containing protein [Septoria linicola]|uniref:WHIM1 domain-containing protein n=1 Tax=Septoria linicola TaxID=215465 RepID=A0A9Q9AL65_9PEZI|nr:Putative WHIM1 domain-containing protein [Septoria linicola]